MKNDTSVYPALPSLVFYWCMGWRVGVAVSARRSRKDRLTRYEVLSVTEPVVHLVLPHEISSRAVMYHFRPYPLRRAVGYCRRMLRLRRRQGLPVPKKYQRYVRGFYVR